MSDDPTNAFSALRIAERLTPEQLEYITEFSDQVESLRYLSRNLPGPTTTTPSVLSYHTPSRRKGQPGPSAHERQAEEGQDQEQFPDVSVGDDKHRQTHSHEHEKPARRLV
jgi:hypothetical protein